MTTPRFRLLDRTAKRGDRARLEARRIPETLLRHEAAAKFYEPDEHLEAAINVALAVGAPLLLTGDPGTGKTQVASYLAQHFDIPCFTFLVRSTSTSRDLFYTFDAVAYFHDAREPGPLNKENYVEHEALWQAFEQKGPCVVLIDEIDKAPRDFPNDLLGVLDGRAFKVPELGREIPRKAAHPPILIITSNGERQLPGAFLRRCIVHHIELDDDRIRAAAIARKADYAGLSEEAAKVAIDRFIELRGRDLKRKPGTAELLVWLTVLSAMPDLEAATLTSASDRALPALGALIKEEEDLRGL